MTDDEVIDAEAIVLEDPVNETPAEPETPPPFTPPVRKLAIWFDFVRADGSTGRNRVFLDWVADLRVVADLFEIERQIAAQANGEYVSVLITNWRALEN